ncbi:hypothetical protein ACFFX0_25665 [Citricoccus parietis]|uniref:Secreted protein n=1 Tax=Citricoccus parietis TaxID=592307 RepID=A0ABV5G621_9MICC
MRQGRPELCLILFLQRQEPPHRGMEIGVDHRLLGRLVRQQRLRGRCEFVHGEHAGGHQIVLHRVQHVRVGRLG